MGWIFYSPPSQGTLDSYENALLREIACTVNVELLLGAILLSIRFLKANK